MPITQLKKRLALSRFGAAVSNWRSSIEAAAASQSRRESIARREALSSRLINGLFQDLTVKSGPFCGLKYDSAESHGSVLLAKLSGTYEAELHAVFVELKSKPYQLIIDVGCAEGYYAVGSAMLWPRSVVHAFDIAPTARALTAALAAANTVQNRVNIGALFTMQDGQTLKDRFGSTLMIVDVEGAEQKFFLSGGDISWLNDVDLIIECHDFLVPGISRDLFSQFSRTHSVEVITSVADIFRPLVFPPKFAESLSAFEREVLIAEQRPSQMCWLVCRSRQS